MWPRLSIVLGLVAGIVVAAIALGALLAYGPDPTIPVAVVSPTPTLSIAPPSDSSSPSTSATASETASASPSLSASPGGIGDPGESGSPATSATPVPTPTPTPTGAAAALFHVGQPAPALVVPKVGGGTIDLSTLKGKPVWVNFMGTYCPPCQDEFPLMNGFAARYQSTGLTVVAIDIREDEATVAAFGQALHTILPMGLDQDGSVAGTWGAIALPVHFWIDAQGIIRDGALGGIGPDIMVRGLKAILPGVDVTP